MSAISSAAPHDDASIIPATWSVNETTRRFPTTLAVFRAFRVDTCCGGGASIADAARTAHVSLDDLLHALRGTTSMRAGGDA
jgi:iron-sulfur cluster repair protein YtfE (RIC family)